MLFEMFVIAKFVMGQVQERKEKFGRRRCLMIRLIGLVDLFLQSIKGTVLCQSNFAYKLVCHHIMEKKLKSLKILTVNKARFIRPRTSFSSWSEFKKNSDSCIQYIIKLCKIEIQSL